MVWPKNNGRIVTGSTPRKEHPQSHKKPTDETEPPTTKKGTKRKAKDGSEGAPAEKRKRIFRQKPPVKWFQVYDRALSQRFYVLSRERTGTDECPEELVQMTGSTGNIYTIHITERPTCTCPHGKRHQCKHYLYVMSRVLRAPFNHVYQLALLPSELRSILAAAPPIEQGSSAANAKDKNRKPVEGDCPICFTEFNPKSQESIVWCRAACGQNIHRHCFETWAKTKRKTSDPSGLSDVTCPMCRSKWEGDDDMVGKIKADEGRVTSDGYVNVANQLNISTVRDTSTYYRGPRQGVPGYSHWGGYGSYS